ncbi:Putative carboxylesterase type b protein [Tolypocladium paradoxum]|uniref:Carboxylesterase type b protein n=1 Tax=Tolypocladium paradoxum TaxID=94208 RepID=A0A2S4KTP3_9HYPO|nr:Putative carboxylesterase type b protein [Tolypocladium paradoxum]
MASAAINLRGTSSLIHGVVDDRFGQPVWHFRGIPYGHIAKRFAAAQYVGPSEGQIDATKFG